MKFVPPREDKVLKRIIFIILQLLLIFAASPAADAASTFDGKCPQCSGKIGRSAVTFREITFCSRRCAEKWRRDSRPKCPVCHAPIPRSGGVRGGENLFCSEKCRRNAGSVCSNCRRMKPKKFLRTFRDGTTVCTACADSGIFDPDRAEKEFGEVREALRRNFGLFIPGEIAFALCDTDELRKLQQRKSDNTNGLCLFYSNGQREIFLRRGLPVAKFRAVAAHELAHDWYNHKVRRAASPEVIEGWAEFVSWHYCASMRYRKEQKEIEENAIKIYSAGFKLVRSKLKINLPEKEIIRRLSDLPASSPRQ